MRRITALSLLTFFITTLSVLGQIDPCAEAKKIVSLMNREHIEPIGLNDSLSDRIFKSIIHNLDPKRIYFTENDFHKLNKQRYSLDDEIRNGDCQFISEITILYKNRLQHTLDYLSKQQSKTLDYFTDETYTVYEKTALVFPKNEAARLERIHQRIKLQTLYRLVHDLHNDTTTTFPDSALHPDNKEKDKVINKWICQINHILHHEDGYETYVAEEFLNAITKSHDPHSAYFNKRKKKEFDLHLSRESETFGLYIEENKNGEFVVSDLSPGGPAWKSNLIHEEDILIGITWPNTVKEDITCATETSINSLLSTSPFKTITLHFKKVDGKHYQVTLAKEVLRVDENTIKSFVIHEDKRIGYLSIPSFYSDQIAPVVQGCANDVAKEVIKLKREQIEGLILDLRHNGGGSLREAIDFSGIFIDEGPICLMKEKNSSLQVVKDFNRGRIYDGPLVILINAFSASASEILASSLQDYNRAVIVGSNSYGKATGQVIVPIDTIYNNFDELIGKSFYSKETYNGYIKLTNSKFYRVNLQSNQQIGVTPDILLPSIWGGYHFTEKMQLYALKNESINKKIDIKKYTELPIDELKIRNTLRKNHSLQMLSLQEIANEFDQLETKTYPLTPSEFWETAIVEINLLDKFIEQSKSQTPLINVKNNASDAIFIEMDELINAINNQLISELESDIVIGEAYQIMSDLVDLSNMPK